MTIYKQIISILTLLLLFLPIWGIISIQISSFIGYEIFISSTRYILLIYIIILSLLLITIKKKIHYGKGQFLILLYFIYCSLHVFGETEYELVIDGFRYEVLFVLLSVVLIPIFNLKINSKIISNKIFINSIILNGVVAVLFGVWQFFDISILEILYRTSVIDIPNIKIALGYRIISVFGNPINYGAFMVVLYVTIHFLLSTGRISLLVYVAVSILIILLIAGTLSRLPFISLIIVMIYNYINIKSISRTLLAFSSIAILLIYILYNYDIDQIDQIDQRFSTLLYFETYSENSRIGNWSDAIEGMTFINHIWGLGLGASSPSYSVTSTTSAVIIENAFISVYYQYGIIGFVLIILIISRFISNILILIKYDFNMGRFIMGIFIALMVMSFGNDFLRNSPFVFYFWYTYSYTEHMRYIMFTINRTNDKF